MPPLKHPAKVVRFRKAGYGKSVTPQGSGRFPVPGRTNLRTEVLVRKLPIQDAEPEHIRDARTLTATALRLKYRTTYDSWKNMKSRRKTQGAIIAPEFELFSSFLAIQGPRPTPTYTLDRLDNDNPTYGPGLCQWRDKIAQANNRRSTIYLNYGGKCLALSEWARQTGQRADTMRKRRAAGWSDAEIVTGIRAAHTQPIGFPWPSNTKEGRDRWERHWLNSNVHDRLDYVFYETKRRRDELEEFLCEHVGDDGTNEGYPDQAREFERIDECFRHYKTMRDRRDRQAETERRYRAKTRPPTAAGWEIADTDEDESEDE